MGMPSTTIHGVSSCFGDFDAMLYVGATSDNVQGREATRRRKSIQYANMLARSYRTSAEGLSQEA